jgi:hypothetical protein
MFDGPSMTDALRYSEMLTEEWTSIDEMAPRPSAFSVSLRKIFGAVLESAFSDAVRFRDYPVREEQRADRRRRRQGELDKLELWMTGGGAARSPFALETVCVVLGYSLSKTRARLADVLYGAPSQAPAVRGSSLTRRAQGTAMNGGGAC